MLNYSTSIHHKLLGLAWNNLTALLFKKLKIKKLEKAILNISCVGEAAHNENQGRAGEITQF